MKKLKFLSILPLVFSILLFGNWGPDENDCKNSVYLLGQSQKRYDTNNDWGKSSLKIHIQEPRVGNPQRYTKLSVNKADNYFEMERNRDFGVEKRIIDGNGNSQVMVNGEENISEEMKEKYRLTPSRSEGYRKFYELMYGLPMSLSEDLWTKVEPAESSQFEGQEVYKIKLELKEEIISKNWTLLLSKENYKLVALEFNHPETPESAEEIIKFEDEIEVNDLLIPRMRHWYVKGTDEYLGSDIIVKTLD